MLPWLLVRLAMISNHDQSPSAPDRLNTDALPGQDRDNRELSIWADTVIFQHRGGQPRDFELIS